MLRAVKRACAGTALVALLLGGCREADVPGGEVVDQAPVVARVDGEPIRTTDLHGLGRLGTEHERRRAVSAAVTRRLVAAEARRRGLADSPAMRAAIASIRAAAQAREEAVLRDALFRELQGSLEPSQAELQEHYAQTRNRYLERQVELRSRTFATREAAEASDAGLGPGGRLDPERAEAIGPAPIRELPRDLLPEVLQLKDSGDRVLVETQAGWSLVELVAVHPAEVQPFEDVRGRVEASWRTLRAQEAFQALLAELEAASEIEIDESAAADESIWDPKTPEAELGD